MPFRNNWAIPTYALYGERTQSAQLDVLHCESIYSRSRLHGWEISLHRHDYFLQILYIRSGQGLARLGGNRIPLEGPCAIVVPATHVHGFQFSPNIDGHVVTSQQKTLPSAALSAFPAPVYQRLQQGSPAHVQLQAAFDVLVAAFANTEPWRVVSLQAALALALTGVAKAKANAGEAGPALVESRAQRHVRRFQELLEQGFREQRRIEHYATLLGITSTQLNRVCRQQLGASALAVMHRRILAEAERDLAYTTLSIKAIAYSLGFSDAAYFSRFFHKQTGSTPGDYRQAAHRRFGR